MLVCIQIYKHLFVAVGYLWVYTSAARTGMSHYKAKCVCVLWQRNFRYINYDENGGIREGPLFSQREREKKGLEKRNPTAIVM